MMIISLAPSDKKKSGLHFDLAMAVGILQQSDAISAKNLSDYGFIGELSLDGRLRACRGILPMIIASQRCGVKKMVVPIDNMDEAKLVHGIEIIGLERLLSNTTITQVELFRAFKIFIKIYIYKPYR